LPGGGDRFKKKPAEAGFSVWFADKSAATGPGSLASKLQQGADLTSCRPCLRHRLHDVQESSRESVTARRSIGSGMQFGPLSQCTERNGRADVVTLRGVAANL